jgi:hypothetical protein
MDPGVWEWVEGMVRVNVGRFGIGCEKERSRVVNIRWRVRKKRAWMWRIRGAMVSCFVWQSPESKVIGEGSEQKHKRKIANRKKNRKAYCYNKRPRGFERASMN